MRLRPVDPVLIVGAGPTGLALALELARFDVPLRIIDRAAHAAEHSQAIALQPRTLELLEPSGVVARLESLAHRVSGLRVAHNEADVVALTFDDLPSRYKAISIVPQSETERALAACLHTFGTEVERNVELTALDEGDDGVDVTLQCAGRTERMRTSYVAGCDGAHSTVRHLTGRRFAGHRVDRRLQLADVTLAANLPPSRAYVHLEDGAGLAAFFPMAFERWRVIVVSSDARDDNVLDREALQRALQRHRIEGEVASVDWASNFSVSQRQVDRYASPRVYLLGDAAHVHSPIGGQGMNGGIGDAVNLGWKMALTLHERTGPELLTTYETERAPAARNVLAATGIGNRLMFSPPAWLATARDRLAPAVAANTALRRRIVETVAQLRVGYPRSPLSVCDGRTTRAVPGARVVGPRFAGYRPQPVLLPQDSAGPSLTLVVRPDGYHGYVGYGLHPSGAALYLRNVIGLGDALRAPVFSDQAAQNARRRDHDERKGDGSNGQTLEAVVRAGGVAEDG